MGGLEGAGGGRCDGGSGGNSKFRGRGGASLEGCRYDCCHSAAAGAVLVAVVVPVLSCRCCSSDDV